MDMPWQPRTPQEKGRQTERTVLKAQGAKAHPGSGSGSIRFDGRTEDSIVEVKEAKKQLTLARSYLELLFSTAIRQQKQARLIIRMPGLRIECQIFREGRPPS